MSICDFWTKVVFRRLQARRYRRRRVTGEKVVRLRSSARSRYLYDAAGNRTGLSGNDGYHAGWDYDATGRATFVRNTWGTPIVQLGYDRAGQRAFLWVLPSISSSTGYGYDDVGRLNGLGLALGGASDQLFGFAYNAASQVVTKTSSNDAYASTSAYNVSHGYSVNGLNQYTAAGPASFAYDLNGNLTSDGPTSYVYDAENRLVTASMSATGPWWRASAYGLPRHALQQAQLPLRSRAPLVFGRTTRIPAQTCPGALKVTPTRAPRKALPAAPNGIAAGLR
jgi:hypothetical protein